MNPFPTLSGNVVAWIIQVSAIALIGTTLPLLFRIRHPKTRLTFLHIVLGLCILLPIVEPWQHPLLIVSGVGSNTAITDGGIFWNNTLKWILSAGIVIRLFWLAGGLLQIRRYRASALPIVPISNAIVQARLLTHSDAGFGISRRVDGPATLGHVDPIVLLPESFLSLDQDAQLSIACHELLHVKRNDWIVMWVEEIVSSIFWFNPAIWWLLSQTRLSRELLVDMEVVLLTDAPAPYVRAMLAMSDGASGLGMTPSTSFLTRGHLARRMRSLLTNRVESKMRSFVSCVSMGGLLATIAVCAIAWFPLTGGARVVRAEALKRVISPKLGPWHSPETAAATKVPTFTAAVPAPDIATGNNVFYVSAVASGPSPQDMTMLSPPLPQPPFLPMFGFLSAPGVRIFRPGDRATPEDIARMQAALGDQTLLEIAQADDGTVQRIIIRSRRSLDETHMVPLSIHSDSGESNAAGPADSSDGVH